jgi:hypothetical protein
MGATFKKAMLAAFLTGILEELFVHLLLLTFAELMTECTELGAPLDW